MQRPIWPTQPNRDLPSVAFLCQMRYIKFWLYSTNINLHKVWPLCRVPSNIGCYRKYAMSLFSQSYRYVWLQMYRYQGQCERIYDLSSLYEPSERKQRHYYGLAAAHNIRDNLNISAKYRIFFVVHTISVLISFTLTLRTTIVVPSFDPNKPFIQNILRINGLLGSKSKTEKK